MSTDGSHVSHSIITPECRENRGDEGAWNEAVARARREYDAIVEGWSGHIRQPTLHLVLGLERPFIPNPEGAFEVRDAGPTLLADAPDICPIIVENDDSIGGEGIIRCNRRGAFSEDRTMWTCSEGHVIDEPSEHCVVLQCPCSSLAAARVFPQPQERK